MAETTNTDLRYRFFNFSFACVLYSLWRLHEQENDVASSTITL
jgi:IS4 transposase